MSESLPPPNARRTDENAWITEGRLPRAVWRLALPMTATMLFHNLFSLVDMFFVGKLGDHALAAVAFSGTMMGIIHMLFLGITTGCTAFVAHAVGSGEGARAQRVAAQSLVMALAFSVLVAALGMPLAGALLRALGAEDPVIEAGRPYLQVMTGGAAAMGLAFTFGAILRGAGDAKTPLVVVAGANLLNIALDPILIFGLPGMSGMGVAGSAWATVISRVAATGVLAWIFFVRGHEQFHLRLADLRPDFRIIGQILKVGALASAQMLIRNISGLVLVRIVAPFGTAAVAAYGVSMRLWFMVLMPGMGFGNAAATLAGQNLGAGRPDRSARAAWMTAGMYSTACALIAVGYWVFASPLVGVFNDKPEVVATGAELLRWVAPTFIFLAMSITLGRAMNGAGDTLTPLVVTFLAVMVVRIPLALGLAAYRENVDGVWMALAASSVIQGLLHMGAFRWGRWKRAGVDGMLKRAAEAETAAEFLDSQRPRR